MTALQDAAAVRGTAGGALTRFPSAPYSSPASYFDAYIAEGAKAAESIQPAALDRAASILLSAYTTGARVFACGNGGSASVANHLQCDHVKGVRTATDLAPRVVSLSANVEILTAIANDVAYADVFAFQLQSYAEPGDVLIAISSSGRSANIVGAVRWAAQHGVRTIALTGFNGGEARNLADVAIHVDATNYGIIEDQHQAVMHALAQYIRQSRMSAVDIMSSVF